MGLVRLGIVNAAAFGGEALGGFLGAFIGLAPVGAVLGRMVGRMAGEKIADAAAPMLRRVSRSLSAGVKLATSKLLEGARGLFGGLLGA